ncbi:MAG: DUF4124 domain-containing protein [Proteobacteria bacterium]|nr:DUF4124 domain-containing protein [Pseudomonadota bacterium]
MSTPKPVWSLLAVVVASVATAATVTYRWTDADGVHYSDQPHPGADKIILGTPATYSSADADTSAPADTSPRKPRNAEGGFHYDSCSIVQPAQDQVLIDIESLTVAVQPRPPKRSTDRVELSFDGQAITAASPDQQEFKISPVDRGTHTVAATIRDSDGKSVCQSTAVSFHVRQPSVLAPQNPNNPARHH